MGKRLSRFVLGSMDSLQTSPGPRQSSVRTQQCHVSRVCDSFFGPKYPGVLSSRWSYHDRLGVGEKANSAQKRTGYRSRPTRVIV